MQDNKINLKKKGKKIMKKLINKWLKSEAYTEYCNNLAILYNYRAAN